MGHEKRNSRINVLTANLFRRRRPPGPGSRRQVDPHRVELRVLSGLHTGARAPLAGRDPVTIGSRADDDVILRDFGGEPGSATVAALPDGWTWQPAGAGSPQRLSWGSLVCAGDVRLTVDSTGAPWPDGLESPSGPSPRKPPPRNGWRKQLGVWTAGIALVVAGTALLASAAWRPTADGEADRPPEPPTQRPATPDLSRAQNAVAALGLSGSVRVTTHDDGKPIVDGVVGTDEELEKLSAAISKITPRPAIGELLVQSEFVARARAVAEDLPSGIEIRVRGTGRVVLTGIARDAGDLAVSKRIVGRSLPVADRIDIEAKTAAEIVAGFADDLSRRELHGLEPRWDGATMVINGVLPSSREADFENAIIAFCHTTYCKQVPLFARIRYDHGAVSTAPTKLPVIAAIVGGDMPYVALEDGRKIMPGGRVGQYLLVAVRNGTLVLADRNRKLVEVSR